MTALIIMDQLKMLAYTTRRNKLIFERRFTEIPAFTIQH